MAMRLLLGAVLGVACGFLSVLGRPPASVRQRRGGWDGEPAPEPDLDPNRWNSQPQNWGPETWSGPANYYNDNYHEDSVNHGDQAAHTGNLGAGQWDDSYSWQQQQWWDAPSSWVQTGWTAGYWDGYAWNTPSWTTPVSSSTSSWTAPSSSSSTRRDDRNGHASSSSPSWTVPSSSRSSTRWDDSSGYGRHAPSMAANVDSEQDSPPPWDDPRAQDSHRRDEREPRDARRDRGDRRDRGWLRPDEERPVGFYRLGVFVPRRRNDYEERFHRGGAGDVRLGRKEARARAWREGTFRPASFWQGMATGSQPSGDGMNFAEALNRHLIPRDHDYEYGVDWQGDGPPVLPHWAIPGMWTSSSVPSSTSSTSPSSTSSTSPSLSSSTTSTTCPCNCQPAEPLGTVDSTSGGGSPEAETNTDENEDTVNLMQQPPPGGGTGPGANNNVDGAGPARLSFHLSEEEIRGFLEAVWPQAVIDNVVEFCNYLEDVAVQYGMEAVAWSGSAWIDSLTVANATVELVQETLFRRLRGVQEARPTVNATRGRLMVGWAGFQRVVSDFHQGLVAEGLREHWLPSRIDADGRRVEDPPFVRGTRGDHDLWAQVRARELARALVEQGRRDGLLRRTGGDGATSSLGGASSSDMVQHQGLRDERGPTTTGGTMDGGAVEEGGIVDGGADDTEEQDGEDDIDEGGLMQVSLEEEERLHRHNVQNEARRHLRTLLLSLEHIQQRGEGPEYRWGVQVLLRAYGMAEEVVGVFREILQRRVSGGQPYFPIVREPPIGALRSRVLSWMGEFRFMLTRALSEELLLQMQELGRVPQVAGGDGSDAGVSSDGGETLASLLGAPARPRSRSPRREGAVGSGTRTLDVDVDTRDAHHADGGAGPARPRTTSAVEREGMVMSEGPTTRTGGGDEASAVLPAGDGESARRGPVLPVRSLGALHRDGHAAVRPPVEQDDADTSLLPARGVAVASPLPAAGDDPDVCLEPAAPGVPAEPAAPLEVRGEPVASTTSGGARDLSGSAVPVPLVEVESAAVSQGVEASVSASAVPVDVAGVD